MVVLERELTAMQPRHRRGEAEPEAGPRLGAALLEAHETLDRTSAVGLRNAASAIRDGEQDPLAFVLRFDDDFGLHTIDRAAIGSTVLDGVIDQVGQRLADELAIAVNGWAGRRFDRGVEGLYMPQRIVELADAAGALRGRQIRHSRAGP